MDLVHFLLDGGEDDGDKYILVDDGGNSMCLTGLRGIVNSVNKECHGVRVGFYALNSVSLLCTMITMMSRGCCCVMLNRKDTSEEILRQTSITGVLDVFVDRNDEEAIRMFPPPMRPVFLGDHSVDLNAAASKAEECLVIFSSGTTGLAKGVRLSAKNLVSAVTLRLQAKTPLERVLLAMPMSHIYGLILCFQAVRTRTSLYFLPPSHGGRAIEQVIASIERFEILEAPLVTPLLRDLAKSCGDGDIQRLRSLRRVHNGGASLDFETLETLRKRMPFVLEWTQGYGLSETCGGFVYTNVSLPFRFQSIGHVLPGVAYRIAPDGEMRVKGPILFLGYLPHVPLSEYLDEDGFFKTGDLVRQDEQGYIYIAGRKKEVFKTKGEQVSPTELEGVILRHCPEVLECAVVGVPHERSGQVPVAHVVLQPGLTSTAESIMARVHPHLAHYKRLHSVVFRESPIPKTHSGKIQRSKL